MFKLRIIPSILSCLRILLTPLFLYLIYQVLQQGASFDFYLAILVYGIICGTDFWDGKIARFLKAESRSGMFLDLAADALFILSSSICLAYLKVLPVWTPLIIFLKLLEFIITSRILSSKNVLVFDPVGRISAVLFYIIPIWTLLFRLNPLLIALFLALVVSTTLFSSFFRVRACVKSFSKA